MNYIINAKEFGLALLVARRRKGLTTQQVSDKVGIGLSTLSLLERGKRRPTARTERRLKKLFPEVFGE